MKNMKNMKYGLLFGLAAAVLMLFASCQDVFNQSAAGPKAKKGYALVKITTTGGGAERTILPSVDMYDAYEYTFQRNGTDLTTQPVMNADGYFEIPFDSVTPVNNTKYTVSVSAYIGDVDAATDSNGDIDYTELTLAATGESEEFALNERWATEVAVGLTPEVILGEPGSFTYTISYPDDADADITLIQWPVGNEITLSGIEDDEEEGYITITETLDNLDAGSYLFTVIVTRGEKSAGIVEAVHILPGLETVYEKAFPPDAFVLSLVTVDFDLNGGAGTLSPVKIVKGTSLGDAYPTAPTKTGYIFDGWWDYSGLNVDEYFDDTTVSASVTLKAKWATEFEEYTEYEVPLTGRKVANDTPATTWNNIFAIDALHDIDTSKFTGFRIIYKGINAAGNLSADSIWPRWGKADVAGEAPFWGSYGFSSNSINTAAGYCVATKTNWSSNEKPSGVTTEAAVINWVALRCTGEVGTPYVKVMSVTFFAAPKPQPAAPVTINMAKAAEDGTIVSKDTSGADYAGISFKLIDQLAGYDVANFDRITFVTEVYDDVAGTNPITTGDGLYTATLFTPWNGDNPNSPTKGYGADTELSDGTSDFPVYGTPGRLQGIGAGVNANAPDGLTTPLSVASIPQGIRFERAGSGSALRNIKVVSIKFWHTAYVAPAVVVNLDLDATSHSSYTADADGSVFVDLTADDGDAPGAQLVCGKTGYGGISFKLKGNLNDKTLADFDLINFVVECYSDTAGTQVVETGNGLFTATLFRTWQDSLSNGGFGGDTGRGFPEWNDPDNGPGDKRQQGIGAGVNAYGPDGLTTNLNVTALPEGIRFENQGGAIKSIRIYSIEFLKKP